MQVFLTVDNPNRWPLNIEGVEVVQAKRYLNDPAYTHVPGARVYNLCKYYRYQSLGYYVSLLAEARGHRPLPSVATSSGSSSGRRKSTSLNGSRRSCEVYSKF